MNSFQEWKGNEVWNAVEFCKGPPLKLDEIGRSIGELNICPKLLLLLYVYIYIIEYN